MKNCLSVRGLLSVRDLGRVRINDLIHRSERYGAAVDLRRPLTELSGNIMAGLFFESSTRTRFGFETAMRRLGGDVISVSMADTRAGGSSHGTYVEPIEDMARCLGQMADILVVRHPIAEAPGQMAKAAGIPVINAGNGMGPQSEHPAQVLGDLYTIHREFGRIDDLSILIAGSLHFRVAHSLMHVMTKLQGIRLYILCPDQYFWSPEEEADFRAAGGDYQRVDTIAEIIDQVDVIYHNGFSEDQMVTPEFRSASVTADVMRRAKPSSIVLHPLPRDFEVETAVDALPQARYFEQVRCGIPMRMAILATLLER